MKYVFSLFMLFFVQILFSQNADYQRLIKEAEGLREQKEYKKAANSYSQAFRALDGKAIPSDRYNAACAWSLAQVPDSAFFHLDKLYTIARYKNFPNPQADEDFENIKKTTQWELLMKKIEQFKEQDLVFAKKPIVLKIDSMEIFDQKWRNLARLRRNGEIDSISAEKISANMRQTDSLHYFELDKILSHFGSFPNFEQVGVSASHKFWLMVQHQDKHVDFQQKVLDLMKVEVDKGLASGTDYALLKDRVNINLGKPQIYGTQVQVNAEATSFEVKEVIDRENLNKRRAEVGLPSIEDYIKMMNEHQKGRLKKQ